MHGVAFYTRIRHRFLHPAGFAGAPCAEPICLGRGRKGVIALRERGHLWEEPQVSLTTVSGPMGLGILEKAG